MLRGIFAFVIVISLGVGASAKALARSGDPQPVHEVQRAASVIDQALSQNQYCGKSGRDGLLDRELGGTLANATEVWSHSTCDSLFATSPPLVIMLGSHDDNLQMRTWYPVCSAAFTNTIRKDLTQPEHVPQADEVAQRVAKEVAELDLCAGPQSVVRDSPDYVPPTQEKYKAKPMTLKARRAYLSEALKIRSFIKTKCCGKEKTCARLMDGIKVTFCKPQSDPKAPDPCTENGTYYNIADSDQERMNSEMKRLGPGSIKGHMPLISGSVALAPLSDEDGDPIDEATTVAHEFTHGCSSIRRQLLVNAGDPAAFEEFLTGGDQYDDFGEPSTGCTLNDGTKELYRKLFNGLGASNETFDCLYPVAADGAHLRFDSTKGCPKGCPRSHVEEALATWMQLEGTHPTTLLPSAFQTVCSLVRDNEHIMGADVVKCALETPELLSRAREGLKCR